MMDMNTTAAPPEIGPPTHSNDTHPYQVTPGSPLYYFIMTKIVYIPLITAPSVLVIAAGILMTELHSPHNTILLAIASSDLLVALFNIPIRLLEHLEVTREMINPNSNLSKILDMICDIVELMRLFIVTILGLDTVIKIKFPSKYIKYISTKKILACIVLILGFVVYSEVIFFLRIKSSHEEEHLSVDTPKEAYGIYLVATFGSLLATCLIFGIYILYCIQWRQKGETTRKITMCLLITTSILYIPLYLMLLDVWNLDRHESEVYVHVDRMIRYSAYTANGLFIYYLSPFYKFAFKYFLSNNPKHWRSVQNIYEEKNAIAGINREGMDNIETAPAMDSVTTLSPNAIFSESSNMTNQTRSQNIDIKLTSSTSV